MIAWFHTMLAVFKWFLTVLMSGFFTIMSLLWNATYQFLIKFKKMLPICTGVIDKTIYLHRFWLIVEYIFVFHFDSGSALYWVSYSQMPDHNSVTSGVCGTWIGTLCFFLPGKCGGSSYYGAYHNIKYQSAAPKVGETVLHQVILQA